MITDTLKVVTDTVKTVADSTAINTITETTIWQDRALMETIGIIGGIIVVLVGILIWDVIAEKKSKKEK